jgi:error-prone DNA polymerase
MIRYSELQVTTNFSFLQGASHPEEYIQQAHKLGYCGIAITDLHSLAGIVRGHSAAQELDIAYIIGCRLELECSGLEFQPAYQKDLFSVLVYPQDIESYGNLCELLTTGKRRSEKDGCYLTLNDFLSCQNSFISIFAPPVPFPENNYADRLHSFWKVCGIIRENSQNINSLSVAIVKNYTNQTSSDLRLIIQTAEKLGIAPVATNNVYYHNPLRRPLQDTVTCIRNKCTIQQAGFLLSQNSERHLKSPAEMARIFREIPQAIYRTQEITEMIGNFSLTSLSYDYPDGVYPGNTTPTKYLSHLTWQGARQRYPENIPPKVQKLIRKELALIRELRYEKYFLTCCDIVRFARQKGILCQGRGSAANSAVCYCLGITAVNPDKVDLLFARFISKERNEPPDIDIDFEHERREEVIQYIYSKYGRNHAALTAEVITYRHRSAIRDTGKALGLSLAIVDKLAKSYHHWTGCDINSEDLKALGLNPEDRTVQNTLILADQLRGFPRHISQHVGGFIISEQPLSRIVPIRNAAMEDRTIIEWDKNDIEALGILKIDILALGMLTCLRKAFSLINKRRILENLDPVSLAAIPPEDPLVYDMICASDTIGVFQIESRAQMSMLPRLRPRCFYDLVIEVAIVRPGPIQGNMVHPYLKRRNGREAVHYPDQRVEKILGKTMGVPIFQEQAMRLAIVLAGFSAGEAEKLRRTMAAWRRNSEAITVFKERIIKGMLKNGYSKDFAESCLNQIKGFSEYGFPESHAASFALLVYASAWQKKYYPAEFCAALINSQPMGFYAPAQIIQDAKNHGVEVRPIDVNYSSWDCILEKSSTAKSSSPSPAVRIGMRLIKGCAEAQADIISSAVKNHGRFTAISDLWYNTRGQGLPLRKATLFTLAKSDSFTSMSINRRNAYWDIQALPPHPLPLDKLTDKSEPAPKILPRLTRQEAMFKDYEATGLSLKSHPLAFMRSKLNQRAVYTAQALKQNKHRRYKCMVSAAGLVLFRQRPGTAKGVVFITLEDETGMVNLIVRPKMFEKYHRLILTSNCILARGILERVGTVVYINVEEMESLEVMLAGNIT